MRRNTKKRAKRRDELTEPECVERMADRAVDISKKRETTK